VQHCHEQHGQRLGEIDKFPRTGMIEDCLRFPQIRLDHCGIAAGLEDTRVGKHHRVSRLPT
jgi:hypothetical protein